MKRRWDLTPGQLEVLEEIGEIALFVLQSSAVLIGIGIFFELMLAVGTQPPPVY